MAFERARTDIEFSSLKNNFKKVITWRQCHNLYVWAQGKHKALVKHFIYLKFCS